jgi:hypothetical protein
MSFYKRYREDEDIQIEVAAGEPLSAESFVLRALSSCARALPADAAEWDVSGLLHDDQPFSRETVSCWLQCCYNSNYGAELDSDSISLLGTVTGLAQVLAFANAVGSFAGALNAACSQVEQLKMVLQLPEQVLELPVGGYTYYYSKLNDRQLLQFNMHSIAKLGAPVTSLEQRHEVQQQVAKQLSALLLLGHVLRLQPLLKVLHQFLLLNSTRVLSGVIGLVFNDAVLEAALCSSTLNKEAYVSSVLSQPCSLKSGKGGHSMTLFKPIGSAICDASTNALRFDAELLRDFAGGKAGDIVKVELELFKGLIRLQLATAAAATSFVSLPVQLLLGRTFPDAAELDAFLKVNPV